MAIFPVQNHPPGKVLTPVRILYSTVSCVHSKSRRIRRATMSGCREKDRFYSVPGRAKVLHRAAREILLVRAKRVPTIDTAPNERRVVVCAQVCFRTLFSPDVWGAMRFSPLPETPHPPASFRDEFSNGFSNAGRTWASSRYFFNSVKSSEFFFN